MLGAFARATSVRGLVFTNEECRKKLAATWLAMSRAAALGDMLKSRRPLAHDGGLSSGFLCVVFCASVAGAGMRVLAPLGAPYEGLTRREQVLWRTCSSP